MSKSPQRAPSKSAATDQPDKIPVEFIEPGGRRRRINVLLGQRLLDAALDADVAGISGQCGGAINCATCLCEVAEEQLVRLPPQDADELELLHWVDEATTNSRLSCQLIATRELAGLILSVIPTR